MRRPCNCNLDTCRMCWHAANTPKYQRLWGLLPGEVTVTCCGPAASARERGAMVVRELSRPLLAESQVEWVRVPTIMGGPVTWAVGVTTVPEREELLHRTLVSLSVGGFGRPQVFVERGLRAFGTWWLGLVELWATNPHADRFMMVQDDVVFVRNCRQYLDKVQHPEKGYWNLFTTRGNELLVKDAEKVGFLESTIRYTEPYDPKCTEQTGWGALALVFSRQALIELLTSRHLVERPMDRPVKVEDGKYPMADRNIDGCVVSAMNKAGYREYVHAPSLVQHVGDESTISRDTELALLKKGVKRERIAKSFPGEGFDATTWLKNRES